MFHEFHIEFPYLSILSEILTAQRQLFKTFFTFYIKGYFFPASKSEYLIETISKFHEISCTLCVYCIL